MPIPSLQHKLYHDDEHDEPHETNRWIVAVKWLFIIAAMGGVVFFFMHVDKEKFTERVSFISDLVEQFDHWIARAAERFAALLD